MGRRDPDRRAQHAELLAAEDSAGRLRKPVLIKRGMCATLEEFLMAAEYVMSEGNYEVILCERGVRTFADHARNTLDLSIVPALQQLSHLPILVDPSHGTGRRDSVLPMARAGDRRGSRWPHRRGAQPSRERALRRPAVASIPRSSRP